MKKLEKMYQQIANNEIEVIMERTRKMLGMAPEEYTVAKMNDTLGKCVNGKITINPELMQYKKEIIEYVVIHEFCHLKYKTHSKKFNELIEENIKYYKKYETISKQINF